MKKHRIHQLPEERLASSSENSVEAIQTNTAKVEENTLAIQALHETSKDKSVEIDGFLGVVKNLQKNTEVLNELKDYVDHPEKVVQKLEEIKSTGLVTNQELKKLNKKEPPTEMEVSLKGVSIVTIKGDKGDKGEKGDKGDTGPKGDRGESGKDSTVAGPKGEKGATGDKGKDGVDGKNGKDGRDGRDGVNGSPDSADDIVEKINTTKGKIDPKTIKGLSSVIDQVDQIVKFPKGNLSSGANKINYRNSSGIIISDHVTDIEFSTGITSVYSGSGKITLTSEYTLDDLTDVVAASPSTGQVLMWNGSNWINDNVPGGGGGGGGATLFKDQTPTDGGTYALLQGTIDGANTVFTVAEGQYITGTLTVWLNGQQLAQGTDPEDWTETNPVIGTFTFNTAPQSSTNDSIYVEYNTTAGGGGGDAAGADTQVQFNDAGSLNGDTTFLFNKTTNVLTVSGVSVTTDITLPNTGLHILDTNATHDLIISPGSNLTADRTLTITTGDSDRTLTLSGNATISGTNTGDQSLAIAAGSAGAIQLTDGAGAFLGSDVGSFYYDTGANLLYLLDETTTYFKSGGYDTGFNFDANSISSGSIRTYTAPDSDGTLTLLDLAQTLQNKTIDASTNTITNIGASEIEAGIITDLTAETTIAGDDVIMIYDTSATALRKMTRANFVAGLGGGGATTALDNLASVAINTTLVSDTDNTDALGTTAIAWSDLFLGSGAVITFNSAPSTADITLTHSADTLTFAGGTLVLPASGLQIGSSNPFSDSAGTLTLQNVDAIDATTESTIEAAIDTLANLTSIQGQTITLSAPFTLPADPNADRIMFWDDSAGATAYLAVGNSIAITTTTIDTIQDIRTSATPSFTGANLSAGTATLGTVAGAIDAGGATSLEVPNGAGGTTVNAAGEVCVDTTSDTLNFYDGTLEAVLTPIMSKSITIESPTAAEDLSLFYSDEAITITKIVFVITGSTSVTTTIRHHTDRSNAGNEVVTGGTTANSTTTGNVVTSFNDATVPADSFLWLETTALSGTPTSLNVTIFYRQDA